MLTTELFAVVVFVFVCLLVFGDDEGLLLALVLLLLLPPGDLFPLLLLCRRDLRRIRLDGERGERGCE